MKYGALLFAIIVSSCNNNSQPANKKEPGLAVLFKDSCDLNPYIIDSVYTNQLFRKADIITQPTAVEFFHLVDEIHKYDGGLKNTLPERFKRDGRQTIYNTIDQYGFYYDMVIPRLKALHVKAVSGNLKDNFVVFALNKSYYVISTQWFKENDGVVFFTPGKKPILYNNKNCSEFSAHCHWEKFIDGYFE